MLGFAIFFILYGWLHRRIGIEVYPNYWHHPVWSIAMEITGIVMLPLAFLPASLFERIRLRYRRKRPFEHHN